MVSSDLSINNFRELNMKQFIFVLLLLFLNINIVLSSACCSTCPEIQKDSLYAGFEPFGVRSYMNAYITRGVPMDMFKTFLSTQPSNITEYLYLRTKDIHERLEHNFARMEVNLD